MSERSPESLFERFRRHGDAEALGRVFDETALELHKIARHLAHDSSEADDLVQATFLTAIEKRDSFDATRRLIPWLMGILLNHASLARRNRRRALEPDRLNSRESEDPLDVVGARELSEALVVALSKLNANEREVLLPLLLDGRRAVEIARELNARPDTIHMRIHRGLAKLRRVLPAGFAVAALMRIGQARGLSAVRAEVVRQAQVQLSVGVGSATAITAVAGGWIMSAKQVSSIVALIVLALGVGGYVFVAQSEDARDREAHLVSSALVVGGDSAAASESALAIQAAKLERMSMSAPSKDAVNTVELWVKRPDGQPANGALVALVDAKKEVFSGKTGANGLCSMSAAIGSADVYVRADSNLPFHLRCEIERAGRTEIALPAGQSLRGRITLQGGEPLPEMEVRLWGNSPPAGFANAPQAVFEALDMLLHDSKKSAAVAKLRADGRFVFNGPSTGWSGNLQLPPEFVYVEGGLPTRTNERPVEPSTGELEMQVAYRPRIIGRLVDVTTERPVASAVVQCTLMLSDGNSMMTGFRTGDDGRFVMPLDYKDDVIGLEISEVQTRDGAVATAKSIPAWRGPSEPHDVGDVECEFPPSRALEFHVRGAKNEPLAGARACVGRAEVVTGDAHGVCMLARVPFDVHEFVVAAPGHAITRVPLTPGTASPLVVTLQRTNRLTIALPPEFVGRSGLYVSLVSRPLLFGDSTRMYDTNLRSTSAGHCWSADGDKGTKEGRVNFTFSDDGAVEVEGVRPNTPFRVRLRGSDSTVMNSEAGVLDEVAIEAMGAEEQRRVELKIAPTIAAQFSVLRGRVVDDEGQPLLGARIGTWIGSTTFSDSSEFDGTFRLEFNRSRQIDLEVSKRGFVPFRAHFDACPKDEVLARLVRGHDLRVELKDARDRWIDGASFTAEIIGFGPLPERDMDSIGSFTLHDLPAGTVAVHVTVAGRNFASEHDTRSGTARITLPEMGRLTVSWNPGRAMDERYDYRVALRPTGREGAEQMSWTPHAERIRECEFQSVLPGEYTVGLELDDGHSGDTDARFRPLHPPKSITVRAGETQSVELTP